MAISTPRCVVVAGMHRSGTSLVAGLLQGLGITMGNRLVPADRANPLGYYEDCDIVAFHQRLFRDCLGHLHDGHPDWGWTPSQLINTSDARRLTYQALALISQRATSDRTWGFKDPRATVLLDFWDPLLPSPIVVGVYREPCNVADSMQRLGESVFLRNPSYARRIWTFYNKRLLDFALRHRERCILLNADALGSALECLPRLLAERFSLCSAAVDLRRHFVPELLQSQSEASTLVRLSRRVWPDCAALYDQLEAIADLPSGGNVAVEPFTFRPRTPSGELSIVLPTHNDATLLVEALASVEDCAAEHHEILVLDDGTTDPESLRILDQLRQTGQPVFRQAHAGLSAARNALITAACGRLILPVDADNRLHCGFVMEALEAFRAEPDLGVVYGDRQLFGLRTDHLRVPELDVTHLVNTNSIDACAMFRRELWCAVGGYDTTLQLGYEDWEFWLHAYKLDWRFRHLPTISLDYRVRPDSLLSKSDSPKGNRQFRHLLWRKHADLLLATTPELLKRVLGLRPPYPANVRFLPSWSRFAVRAYWHLAWARASRNGKSQ